MVCVYNVTLKENNFIEFTPIQKENKRNDANTKKETVQLDLLLIVLLQNDICFFTK